MSVSKPELEKLINEGFPEADFEIIDLAGDGDHYELKISCKSFSGLSKVMQHRKVYEALQGKMGGELHALAIQTYVKE